MDENQKKQNIAKMQCQIQELSDRYNIPASKKASDSLFDDDEFCESLGKILKYVRIRDGHKNRIADLYVAHDSAICTMVAYEIAQ